MLVKATLRATQYIQRRGGRLYVWFENVGASNFAMQRVRFAEPDGVVFTRHALYEFDIYLQASFAPPAELRVRRRPWPIGPIEVIGTGAGSVDFGGGGGDGGGWPSGHGGGDGGGGGHGGHSGH